MYAPTDGDDGGQTTPANYFDDAAQAEQAIKAQFQMMMQNPNNQIFETMWANANLRESIFGQVINPNNPAVINSYRSVFQGMVTSLDEAIFKFIKVE